MVDYTKVEHATIRNYRGEEKAKENSATGLAATLNMSLSSSHKYGCDLREGFFFPSNLTCIFSHQCNNLWGKVDPGEKCYVT